VNRDYDFHQNCYRYTHGNPPSKEETHPCFFCGESLPLTTEECKKCGIMICSNCKNCFCTVSDDIYKAAVNIHRSICCHLNEYDGKIYTAGDEKVLKSFKVALDNCFRLEFGKDPE
jgi:hypothetical protein